MHKVKTNTVILLTVVLIFSLIYLITVNVNNNFNASITSFIPNTKRINSTYDFLKPERRKGWINIELYTTYWNKMELWSKMFYRILHNECEESRCHINTDEFTLEEADAVIFYANDLYTEGLNNNKSVPEILNPVRNPNQVFVLYVDEPPPYVEHINFEIYKNFFNWTMSYVRDADIFIPYGKVIKRTQKRPQNKIPYLTDDELKNKKLAVAVISHCSTPSRRQVLVTELERYIPIEIYGKCGNLTCGFDRDKFLNKNITDDPCVNLIKNYTFYLSLENSICQDYITEKFFRPLALGAIPVVLGGGNYSQIAPPNSFIDVKDFQSVEQLANYLKMVANDANLYNKYIEWRNDYDVEIGHFYKPFVCDLCKKLHSRTSRSKPKFLKNVKDWFLKEACKSFQDTVHYNMSETMKKSILAPLTSLFIK